MLNVPTQETWLVPDDAMADGVGFYKNFAQATHYQGPAGGVIPATGTAGTGPSAFVTKVVFDEESITASLAFDPRRDLSANIGLLLTTVPPPVMPKGFISREIVKRLARATNPRPRPYSLWPGVPGTAPGDAGYVSDYTSWPSLTRRDYSGRHMQPADPAYVQSLPADDPPTATTVGQVTALFLRGDAMKPSRSSVLFMFFAQWFTDSFLRFKWDDRRQNTSNHEIDLCQIYGLDEGSTTALRARGTQGEVLATLACRLVRGEEYPDYIHIDENDISKGVKTQYAGLSCVTEMVRLFPKFTHRYSKFYATGLEQGNSSVGYVAINTLFLREHNRLVRQLRTENPAWDEERLFQTARNINIVILIKLVTEVYIAHLTGNNLIKLEVGFAEKEPWYRTNWIAAEFDLLYRWHSLIPDTIRLGKDDLGHIDYRCNNALFEQAGLEGLLSDASSQMAGAITLENSPSYLIGAEYAALKMGRDIRLQPYNEYRKNFSLPPIVSFEALTDDVVLRDKLKTMYGGDINKLEFLVGLYAEKPSKPRLYGDLMTAMVAYDAMTHIHTNPLLSTYIYNANTFTQMGLDTINRTNTLNDLVDRNLSKPSGVTVKFGVP